MILYFAILVTTTITSYVLYGKKSKAAINVKLGRHSLISIRQKENRGCFAAFLILAFFSAVREGIGIDYNSYLYHIALIQNGNPHYMETGFKKLVTTLEKINSDPKFVIIILGILTTWLFVKAIWEQSDNPAESIFIFVSWGYYFLTYNTIRNYLALAIVIYAIRFIKQDKKIWFFLLVILAASFHKSALICLLVYFLADLEWKKVSYALLGAGIVFAFVFKNFLRTLVFYFYPAYEGSVYDSGRISYLNILKALLVLMLCIFRYGLVNGNRLNRLYFHLNLFSLTLYVGMYWVPEISRIGFYMNATSIFLIPNIIKGAKTAENRKVLKIILYIVSLILFFLLCRGFYGETIKLLPYKSWLF